MKQSILMAVLTAFVAAQSIDDLPACSDTCLADGIAHAGCNFSDIECACAHVQPIDTDITPCLQTSCSKDDEAYFRILVVQICADYGVPIDVPPTIIIRENYLHEHHVDDVAFAVSLPLLHANYPSPLSVTVLTPEPVPSTPYLSFTGTVIIVPDSSTTEVPCIVHTITLTQTQTETVAVTNKLPPYPTPSANITPPTTATESLQPSLPTFTNGAEGMSVGGVVVGLVGIVALIL